MGEVIGYLRPDKATYGEKLVLQKLETSLPPDFTIYVECPLHDDRLEHFPDFIILANYGVVVLEVKDWVQIVKIDKYGAYSDEIDHVFQPCRPPVGAKRR
jgi:hypothetical protein